MSNDTCPYCGCGKYNDEIYWCNTRIADPSKSYEHRSDFCRKIFGLKEQSEQQAAEIEQLRAATRDMFAAHAMQAILSCHFDMQEEKLAELAYTQADAMMRRRGEL